MDFLLSLRPFYPTAYENLTLDYTQTLMGPIKHCLSPM